MRAGFIFPVRPQRHARGHRDDRLVVWKSRHGALQQGAGYGGLGQLDAERERAVEAGGRVRETADHLLVDAVGALRFVEAAHGRGQLLPEKQRVGVQLRAAPGDVPRLLALPDLAQGQGAADVAGGVFRHHLAQCGGVKGHQRIVFALDAQLDAEFEEPFLTMQPMQGGVERHLLKQRLCFLLAAKSHQPGKRITRSIALMGEGGDDFLPERQHGLVVAAGGAGLGQINQRPRLIGEAGHGGAGDDIGGGVQLPFAQPGQE